MSLATKIPDIILAACILHNFVLKSDGNMEIHEYANEDNENRNHHEDNRNEDENERQDGEMRFYCFFITLNYYKTCNIHNKK